MMPIFYFPVWAMTALLCLTDPFSVRNTALLQTRLLLEAARCGFPVKFELL